MKHLEEARDATDNEYIYLDDGGQLCIIVQDGPIKEVGVNGCQAVDMLEFTKHLFISLNNAYPCRENSLTITKIEEAIHWQTARTADRESRNVEGLLQI